MVFSGFVYVKKTKFTQMSFTKCLSLNTLQKNQMKAVCLKLLVLKLLKCVCVCAVD